MLFFLNSNSQNSTLKNQFQKNKATYHGEVIAYKIHYALAGLYIHAGEVSFTNTLANYEGKKVYHIKGYGYTYKKYDWIYSVSDIYETYIDTTNMLSYFFRRNTNEGGRKNLDTIKFNRIKNTAISNGKFLQVTNYTYDVLSAIYMARQLDYSYLKPNQIIPLDMLLDNELHHLYIRYIGKEKILFKHKWINCLKIKPLLVKGTIFSGGEAMSIWISDDEKHIPVVIEAPILVGKIKAELKIE